MNRRADIVRRTAFRTGMLFVGVAAFYAPFALLVRGLLWLTNSPLVADAHRVCLRMPFEWALQPWMYPTMIANPLFLIGLVGLPLAALFIGPWFCGNLCPAGLFPELLSRVVPRKLQIRLQGRVTPMPIRYGVLAAMMLSPFLGGYVCCTFCNFTMMQNVVSAATGDFSGMAAWASFTVVTFVLWLFVLGIFFAGGRGFCALLCPAGAVQGMAYALGRKAGWAKGIRVRDTKCRRCGHCIDVCPMLAVETHGTVNVHACNVCLECVARCPHQALVNERGIHSSKAKIDK